MQQYYLFCVFDLYSIVNSGTHLLQILNQWLNQQTGIVKNHSFQRISRPFVELFLLVGFLEDNCYKSQQATPTTCLSPPNPASKLLSVNLQLIEDKRKLMLDLQHLQWVMETDNCHLDNWRCLSFYVCSSLHTRETQHSHFRAGEIALWAKVLAPSLTQFLFYYWKQIFFSHHILCIT